MLDAPKFSTLPRPKPLQLKKSTNSPLRPLLQSSYHGQRPSFGVIEPPARVMGCLLLTRIWLSPLATGRSPRLPGCQRSGGPMKEHIPILFIYLDISTSACTGLKLFPTINAQAAENNPRIPPTCRHAMHSPSLAFPLVANRKRLPRTMASTIRDSLSSSPPPSRWLRDFSSTVFTPRLSSQAKTAYGLFTHH